MFPRRSDDGDAGRPCNYGDHGDRIRILRNVSGTPTVPLRCNELRRVTVKDSAAFACCSRKRYLADAMIFINGYYRANLLHVSFTAGQMGNRQRKKTTLGINCLDRLLLHFLSGEIAVFLPLVFWRFLFGHRVLDGSRKFV